MVARKDALLIILTVVVLSALFFIYFQAYTHKQTVTSLSRKLESSEDLVSQYKSYLEDARTESDKLGEALYAEPEAPKVNTTDEGFKIEESVTGKRIITNTNNPAFSFEIPVQMYINNDVYSNEDFSSLTFTNKEGKEFDRFALGAKEITIIIWENDFTEEELTTFQGFSIVRDSRNKYGVRIREVDRSDAYPAMPYGNAGYLIYVKDKILYVECNQVDILDPKESDIRNLDRSTEVWKACEMIANTIQPL